MAFSLFLQNILFAQSERTIRQKTEIENVEDNKITRILDRLLESRLYNSFGKIKYPFETAQRECQGKRQIPIAIFSFQSS